VKDLPGTVPSKVCFSSSKIFADYDIITCLGAILVVVIDGGGDVTAGYMLMNLWQG
jgi:hypothetical protein